MPYTLWSRGRLLGETDLGFAEMNPNHRMGWFRPSPLGEVLMPILVGPGPAMKAVGRLMRDPVRSVMRPNDSETPGDWPADIRTTTEYADLVSSVDELASMELQLRDANGMIIVVEHVGVDDMEFKKSLLSKRERKRWDRLSTPEPWEPPLDPLPRYQIQVFFPGQELADEPDPPVPG